MFGYPFWAAIIFCLFPRMVLQCSVLVCFDVFIGGFHNVRLVLYGFIVIFLKHVCFQWFYFCVCLFVLC